MAKDTKKPQPAPEAPTEPKATPAVTESTEPAEGQDWAPKSGHQWRKYVIGPGRKS